MEEYIFLNSKAKKDLGYLRKTDEGKLKAAFKVKLDKRFVVNVRDDGDLTKKVFYHNPLHDLESLWWICFGKLFCHQVVSTVVEDGKVKEVELVEKEQFMRQWQIYSEIFPSAISNRKRINFLKDDAVFRECISTLSPQLSGVLNVLSAVREELVDYYLMVEADYPNISEEVFKTMELTELSTLFASAIQFADGLTLKDFPEEWINEYNEIRFIAPLPAMNKKEVSNRTSVKRESDSPALEERSSKLQR